MWDSQGVGLLGGSPVARALGEREVAPVHPAPLALRGEHFGPCLPSHRTSAYLTHAPRPGRQRGHLQRAPVGYLPTRSTSPAFTPESIEVMKRLAGHVRGGPPSPTLRRCGCDRRSGGSGGWNTLASTCTRGTARCASWERVGRWCWSSG